MNGNKYSSSVQQNLRISQTLSACVFQMGTWPCDFQGQPRDGIVRAMPCAIGDEGLASTDFALRPHAFSVVPDPKRRVLVLAVLESSVSAASASVARRIAKKIVSDITTAQAT
jgi:hypothetical protein